MRLPRIKTRMANILAKLAGSEDYDPKVKPLTPAEYYANQIPVIPKPTADDEGMALVADAKGGYTLGGGGGGGANVLTLYLGINDEKEWCYKNAEKNESYANYQEALYAIRNADIIKLVGEIDESLGAVYTSLVKTWQNDSVETFVSVTYFNGQMGDAFLYYSSK